MRRSRPFLFFHLNAQVHNNKKKLPVKSKDKSLLECFFSEPAFFPPCSCSLMIVIEDLVGASLYVCAHTRAPDLHQQHLRSASLPPPPRTQRKLKALCRYVFNGPCFFSFSLTLFFFFPSPSLRLDAPSLPPSLPLVNLIQGPGWQKRGE